MNAYPALEFEDTGLRLPPRARLPLVLALSLINGLGCAFMSLLISAQSLESALTRMAENTPGFLAGALFLGLLTAVLTLISRSLFAGGLIVALPVLTAALVNHYKLLITSTPLMLTDLALIGKLGAIAEMNSQSISFSSASLLAITAAAIWLLLLLFLSRPLRPERKRALAAAGAALTVFGLLFMTKGVANAWCYRPLGVPTDAFYDQAYVNSQCGVPLGLWRSLLASEGARTPELGERDVLLNDARGYIDAVPAGGEVDGTPNVIMILSESFFDLTTLPGVSYEEDPIADFHALKKDSVSGTFFTRTLGYGTCDIELQMLTGINNRFLPSEKMLCEWDADELCKLPTVPQLFRESGYYTAYLHTFNDGIYNREPKYSRIGFDGIYFSKDFAEIDPEAAEAEDYWAYMQNFLAGGNYSDDYMGELIIDLFEREEKPIFLYAATVQNHTPFTADRYESYDFPFEADISEEAAGVLSCLTQGAADSSEMLGKLVEYFSALDEPTVIIFFGDHRPGLPLEDGGTAYAELGLCPENAEDWTLEQFALMYSTDYLIWANDESLLPARAGSVRDTSCAYLGLTALRLAGLPLDPYWRMIASVEDSCTAYNWRYIIAADGSLHRSEDTLDEADRRKLEVMSQLMREALSAEDKPAFYELTN